MPTQESPNRRYDLKCDTCGITDRGTKKELADRGWKMAEIRTLKFFTITYCKEHGSGYNIEIGLHIKQGHGLRTKIGGMSFGGKELQKAWEEEKKHKILVPEYQKLDRHLGSVGVR